VARSASWRAVGSDRRGVGLPGHVGAQLLLGARRLAAPSVRDAEGQAAALLGERREREGERSGGRAEGAGGGGYQGRARLGLGHQGCGFMGQIGH
jgi:hypothetical protein